MDAVFPLDDITNVRAQARGTLQPTLPPPGHPRGKENAPPGRAPRYSIPEFARWAVDRAGDDSAADVAGSGTRRQIDTRGEAPGGAIDALCRCGLCLCALTVAFVPTSDVAAHGHLHALCDRCATAMAGLAKKDRLLCPLCVKFGRRPARELAPPYFRFSDQRTVVALAVSRCSGVAKNLR